jgi:hypothetical protein
MKKLELEHLRKTIKKYDHDVEYDDRFFDRTYNLFALEHYGHYIMGIKKERSIRIYLTENKYLEFVEERINRKEYYYPKKINSSKVFIYTKYPQYTDFIKDAINLMVDTKSYSIIIRRLNGFIIFLEQYKKLDLQINSIIEIDNEIEKIIYKLAEKSDLKKKDKINLRGFFGFLEKINLSFNSINYFDNLVYHKTKALHSTIIHQLEYYSILEIKKIIKNVEEYYNWKEEFKNIKLFSLPNLAKTFYDNIELKKLKYQSNVKINELSNELYSIDLIQWKERRGDKYRYTNEEQMLKHLELKQIAEDGININIENEKMFFFWFNEVVPDYPFNNQVQDKYKKVFKMSFFKDKFYTYLGGNISIFYRRLSPTIHELYPLFLLLLIREGLNSEVLSDWKVTKTKDGSFAVGDKTPFCLSIISNKGRGSKQIHVSIHNDSEQIHFIDFYLKWLETIYLRSDNNHFFQYFSLVKGPSFKKWTPNSLTMATALNDKTFYSKYKIYDQDNSRIYSINHQRIRPYNNYADHLKGYSNFERQIRKSHNKIDTQAHYENSTEWTEQKNHNIAKTQELLVDIFKGKIDRSNHFAVELFQPGLFADCANTKEPTYYGAKDLKDDENCTNWRYCLIECDKARVIPEVHGKTIYAWIKFMEEEKERFYHLSDWDKEYALDYEAASVVFNELTEDEKYVAKEKYTDYLDVVQIKFKSKSKHRA